MSNIPFLLFLSRCWVLASYHSSSLDRKHFLEFQFQTRDLDFLLHLSFTSLQSSKIGLLRLKTSEIMDQWGFMWCFSRWNVPLENDRPLLNLKLQKIRNCAHIGNYYFSWAAYSPLFFSIKPSLVSNLLPKRDVFNVLVILRPWVNDFPRTQKNEWSEQKQSMHEIQKYMYFASHLSNEGLRATSTQVKTN